MIALARRFLPETPPTGRHRLDVIGSLVLGAATFCVLFGAVQSESAGPVLLWLAVPALVLLGLFFRRERRLTEQQHDPLVDLRLFRRPSYTSGVVLALLFFPAMAGLPLVMALYFQRGLGYSAIASALGVTAYAVGNAVAAPLAGRVVDRLGRSLVVGAALTFGAGAVGLALVARSVPTTHATLAMAAPLFVMGLGAGALITPNQALTLMDVDPSWGARRAACCRPRSGSGSAVGQAVIGAVFFASIDGPGPASYAHAVEAAVLVALVFVAASVAVGVRDLLQDRRRRSHVSPRPEPPLIRAGGGAGTMGTGRTTRGRARGHPRSPFLEALPARGGGPAGRRGREPHAGDVCLATVLDELAQRAPVLAVRGNNDGADVADWGAPDVLQTDLSGCRWRCSPTAGSARGAAAGYDGCSRRRRSWCPWHSHIPWEETTGGHRALDRGIVHRPASGRLSSLMAEPVSGRTRVDGLEPSIVPVT